MMTTIDTARDRPSRAADAQLHRCARAVIGASLACGLLLNAGIAGAEPPAGRARRNDPSIYSRENFARYKQRIFEKVEPQIDSLRRMNDRLRRRENLALIPQAAGALLAGASLLTPAGLAGFVGGLTLTVIGTVVGAKASRQMRENTDRFLGLGKQAARELHVPQSWGISAVDEVYKKEGNKVWNNPGGRINRFWFGL